MGRFTFIIFCLFAFQFAAMLYLGVSMPGTAIYQMVINPGNSVLENNIYRLLIGVGAIGIAAGLYFIRSDFAFYAALGAAFLLLSRSYVEVYKQMVAKLPAIPSTILLIFFVPFILPYIFVILDWIRGRD